jgi:hypothetical protein
MATNDGGERSFFARYIDEPKKGRPLEKIPRGPMLRPEVPLVDIKSPPIERLIAWLVLRWPKATVFSKDIMQYGPNPLRDRKSARASAEILVKHGWLTPLKTRRYDAREWRIERGPSGSSLTKE